jgi:hypothetical protein
MSTEELIDDYAASYGNVLESTKFRQKIVAALNPDNFRGHIAVEGPPGTNCLECAFNEDMENCKDAPCIPEDRKDGKLVHFVKVA